MKTEPTIPTAISVPAFLHGDSTKMVMQFAEAMAQKMRRAELKYGYSDGWKTADWEAECRQHLLEHLAKGDPLDVAIYCAFMWSRGWPTVGAVQQQKDACK